MPRVSAEHMQARRDQIARAAVDQFSLRGIHSTSMANIIEASGLSSGAIYTHFASKDEIIGHVARTAIDGVFASIRGLLDANPLPSPRELIALIAVRIGQADVSSGFIVQVWGEAATNATVRQTANEVYAHALDFLREYVTVWLTTSQGIELRRAREQAPAQARLLIGLVYSYILQDALIEDHDDNTFVADVAALLPPSGGTPAAAG